MPHRRFHIPRRFRVAGLVVWWLLGLAGCQTVSFDEARPSAPNQTFPHRYRAFTTPSVLVLQTEPAAAEPGLLPWYFARHDAVLATYVGWTGPTYEASTTYTVDQQYTSGASVRDFYSSTTYRVRGTETVR